LTNIKQVYNARVRWRKSIRSDKTEMQYLVKKLEKHKYIYFTRTNCEETTLEDIFCAHMESINMLNTFLAVLVMDSTYKTNMYIMQYWLEIWECPPPQGLRFDFPWCQFGWANLAS